MTTNHQFRQFFRTFLNPGRTIRPELGDSQRAAIGEELTKQKARGDLAGHIEAPGPR